MEGFAEYNYATVSDENAKELEKLVNKVTEKVPKIKLDSKKNEKSAQTEGDDVGTSDQTENPDAENPQAENDLSISFGKLFNSVKKKVFSITCFYYLIYLLFIFIVRRNF
jgi:Skp family chaperone for outer membrane proteins